MKILPLSVVLKIFLLGNIIMIFSTCNLTYKVRNQHNDIEETLYLPCGKVTIELVGKGNSKFVFRQKFDLDEKAIVYKDSLKICYNEKQIVADHNLKNGKNIRGGIEIKENKLWEASFEFEKGVFEGDTIMVFGLGYVKCKDQVITLDTMVYSFVNSLRIYGVNDF
ncbi:MAG: hypothetical protein KAR17_19755 [Cyclobacteriaceae bacterium]|nr:hypothetical protein [Cyclobacteriaceae bacterium]